MSSPTLRDVAQLAGVHPATASRALNPPTRPLVNADTARKVLRAAESIGYQPNPIARSLKTARTSTVGLVIPDLTNPLFPPIVRGIEDVLSPAGYSAWIVNTDNDPTREETQVESLRSRQVEGLIVATARRDHPLLVRLHRPGRADGAGQPAGRRPGAAVGDRRRRRRHRHGRRAPGRAGAPADRPPGRPADTSTGVVRAAGVPARGPRPRAGRRPGADRRVRRTGPRRTGARALRGAPRLRRRSSPRSWPATT